MEGLCPCIFERHDPKLLKWDAFMLVIEMFVLLYRPLWCQMRGCEDAMAMDAMGTMDAMDAMDAVNLAYGRYCCDGAVGFMMGRSKRSIRLRLRTLGRYGCGRYGHSGCGCYGRSGRYGSLKRAERNET